MTDRELLEAAARAAGLIAHDASSTGLWVYPIGSQLNWDGEYPIFDWNPLTDDGDALRLAVQIGPLEFSISEYGTAVRKPKGEWFGCEAHLHGGKQAATRRAIVRAAASLSDAATKEASQP